MPNLSKAQQIELDIYKAVAEICKYNGIRYFALGGTLLGAIRHKGFIPWDDDMDIAVPRPDYDRLMGILHTELPDYLEPVTYQGQTRDDVPVYFCQVFDRRTRVKVAMANEERVTSLWLDVFPLDAMPTNGFLRQVQKYRLLYRRMRVQMSNFDKIVHQHRSNRPWHERALIKFVNVTHAGERSDPVDQLAKTERAARSYDYEREDWIVNLWGVYKFREMFPKSWFGQGVELPFEDTVVPCPVEYDKVLTQMYGDYMTPPPASTRDEQHCMTVLTTGEGQDGQ